MKNDNSVVGERDVSGENPRPAIFPVVALGASAGGLEASEKFFAALPVDCGMAFILIFHLDPDHVSLLPELIQRKTTMPVIPVSDNLLVEPNHIYILPPDKEMLMAGELSVSAGHAPAPFA